MLLRASVKIIKLLPPRVRETPCLLGDFDWSCLFLWCNFDVLVINTFPTKVFFLQSGNDRPMYMYAYGNTNIVGNLKLSIGYLKQPTDNIGNHSPSTITRYASKLLATACSFSFFRTWAILRHLYFHHSEECFTSKLALHLWALC